MQGINNRGRKRKATEARSRSLRNWFQEAVRAAAAAAVVVVPAICSCHVVASVKSIAAAFAVAAAADAVASASPSSHLNSVWYPSADELGSAGITYG